MKGVVLSPDVIRGDRHPLAGATNTNEKPRNRFRDVAALIDALPAVSTAPSDPQVGAHPDS